MITHLVFDFSWVLLFPRDKSYRGKLNSLNDQLAKQASYNPINYFRLNTELLKLLSTYRSTHKLIIFTAGRMHALPAIKSQLDQVFYTYLTESQLGHPKSSPSAYTKLASHLDCLAENILFADDQLANIQAAKLAGIKTIHYFNNHQLKREIEMLLEFPL